MGCCSSSSAEGRMTPHLKMTNTGIMEEYILVSQQIHLLLVKMQKEHKPPAN